MTHDNDTKHDAQRLAASTPDAGTDAIEAAVFRRLRAHLVETRPDVQNIDLMVLAGFCRNCLADWYREAAASEGVAMDKGAARDAVYGGSFAAWKAQHQRDATPQQLEALAHAQSAHDATG